MPSPLGRSAPREPQPWERPVVRSPVLRRQAAQPGRRRAPPQRSPVPARNPTSCLALPWPWTAGGWPHDQMCNAITHRSTPMTSEHTTPTTLADQIAALNAALTSQAPAEVLATYDREIEAL